MTWVFPYFERHDNAIECECGGYAKRDRHMTEEECKEYGCGRDKPHYQCCARAFVCKACNKRYLVTAPAPDME